MTYNVGDEVEFTSECNDLWWFGPHTEYKTGYISKICISIGSYEVKSNHPTATGIVQSEHIRPLVKMLEYDPSQQGDREDDV